LLALTVSDGEFSFPRFVVLLTKSMVYETLTRQHTSIVLFIEEFKIVNSPSPAFEEIGGTIVEPWFLLVMEGVGAGVGAAVAGAPPAGLLPGGPKI
jgi:hypothetical protein